MKMMSEKTQNVFEIGKRTRTLVMSFERENPRCSYLEAKTILDTRDIKCDTNEGGGEYQKTLIVAETY